MTATLSPEATPLSEPTPSSPQGQSSPDAMGAATTRVLPRQGTITSPETIVETAPRSGPSQRAAFKATTSGHVPPVAHKDGAAGGSDSVDAQCPVDIQTARVVSGSMSPPTNEDPTPPAGPSAGPILADPLLALLADAVDDLERIRIAAENRFRQLTRTEIDNDGEERGFGLSVAVPEVKRVRDIADGLATLEHQAVLSLQRQVRKHPLWKVWGKEQPGVGEKQAARLFAAIGDPYWNTLHDRPRTVSELWAYCGYSVVHPGGHLVVGSHEAHAAGVAPKRQRGQKGNWSAAARMRAWLVATSCVKQPDSAQYRQVYEAARAKYDGALHGAECVRCGPKGNPAPAGSPLSAGHQHARAVRAISKEILRDLWLAARDLHQE